MKKYILMAAFLSAATFITSCSEDDIDSPVKRPTAYTGDEVQFSIEGKRSRTMYQSNWNATNTQELYWGNYNSEVGDSIKIYCFQGARQIATYSVQPGETNSSVADGIAKTGAYGIQWGSESEQHQFYAFYPAMYGGDQFVDNNPGKIRAKVDVGQSPVSYVAYSTTDTELQTVKYNGIPDINANRTVDPDNSVVICGQPDMKQAIMVARNTTAKYGDVVGLRFNVLADVLDISINGPIVPNTLGGNANEGKSKPNIQIHNVRVESKSGKTLSGNFTLDMSADAEKMVTNITGNPYVQLQTSSVVNGLPVYPSLFARASKKDGEKVGYGDIDHLRLRAFLIPGQVTDLSDLQIVIETDCGTFTQELNSGAMTSGYIHKISLKYFKQRGTEFDYTKWMSQLDPTIYVNELSIPGAWHAVNSSYQATTDFTEMYDKGIRGFEFHVNINGNIQDTETPLSTALKELGKAIQDHGGNGFVMVEIGDPYSSEKFPAAVNAQLELAKDYIYQTEITANTTIKDVAGKIIIKINTNDVSENGSNESGWTNPTPALFSRWQFGSKGEAYTEALQWGQPIAPDASSSLYWCFTEADNTENGNVGGIDARKSAIDDLMKKSLAAWSKNEHDTWYECGVGGYTTTKPTTWGSNLEENPYTNGSTNLTNYQNAAAILNLYLLGKLSDPNRAPSPLGLILMNFCTGTTNYPEAFGSAALIRTIINNNSAFILNRAGATPKNAADEHNVVVNNGGNAVE